MLRKPPKYVQGFVDKTGRPRFYLRRPGFTRAPLPGLPWSPQFMAAYEAAMAGDTLPKLELGIGRTVPGTINALIVSYYRSPEFVGLKPITQSTYRNVIERFRMEHGDKPVARLERDHVGRIMAKLKDKPAAANQWLKVIRVLMRHAMSAKLRKDDPTFGLRKFRMDSSGYRTWTEDEVATYYATHPVGTRPRLALDLLLFTAQRRSDVVRMGKQHVRDGWLTIRQSKTGTEVAIPVHADLQDALAHVPADTMTFLLTAQGKPFSPAGFTNWFRDCVVKAKLPAGLSPHGLRKTACTRLANAGCSASQIMAISGHVTLGEAEKYVREANKRQLAADAMGAIKAVAGTKIVKRADAV